MTSRSAWRDQIIQEFGDAEFSDAATENDIGTVEAALSLRLPDDLRSLLIETNGVTAEYGTSIIWSADEIVRRNQEMRSAPEFDTLYMSFDSLLFFGEGGNGDLFCYRVLAGVLDGPDVYRWDHEDDSRVWFARDLVDYLGRFARGTDE